MIGCGRERTGGCGLWSGGLGVERCEEDEGAEEVESEFGGG